MDELRYIKKIIARVSVEDKPQKICEVEFRILSLERAKIDGFDIEQIFDNEANSYNYGELFYDYSHNCYKDILIEAFPELEIHGDLCIIDSIAMDSNFRKKGLAAKVFKDIVLSFDLASHLFVLKPFPLQFSSFDYSEFIQKLDFKTFDNDEEIAKDKLMKYYKSWGFNSIDGISDLMFFYSGYRNSFFDAIEIDDAPKDKSVIDNEKPKNLL